MVGKEVEKKIEKMGIVGPIYLAHLEFFVFVTVI